MNLKTDKTPPFGSFILIGIMLIGAMLRLYHFSSLPFTFDELSATSRHYYSVDELIQKAVIIIDFHPAGSHLFIYAWQHLFGNIEWVIKLPFVLMGISCIYLTYRIGKDWFNETCGLVAALFIGTLQFTICYSTIARPYVSGLFFSLLMVVCWTNYFFNPNKNKLISITGFILSASACMYNHYFSFLFAMIVSFTGLFFLSRQNWKHYILAGIVIIILFLPHLQITLFQLGKGGLGGPDGWLGPPENDFFLRFIGYTFHYSWLAGGIIAAVVGYYFITEFKGRNKVNKFRIICITWFLLPFLIAFFYSKWVNPVLQFSILIFSFPYFIILISSYINETRKWILISLLILIGTSNIYSLVYKRKHFEIMLHQASNEYAKYIMHLQQRGQGKKIFAILTSTENTFMDYYKEIYNINFDYYIFEPKKDSPADLLKLLRSRKVDYLITGMLPGEYNAFFQEEFPKRIHYAEGFTFDINCFSKESTENEIHETILFDETNNFNQTAASKWCSFDVNGLKKDSITKNNYFVLDSSQEWGPGFKIALNEIVKNCNPEIIASVKIKPGIQTKDGILVFQINKGDSMVHWQGGSLKKYFIEGHEWQTIYTSCRMIDILRPGRKPGDYTLSVYFWNIEKQKVYLDDLRVKVTNGNPLIYGLFENIVEDK